MSITTGWIKVPGLQYDLKVIAKGERLHIKSYHPMEPYIHSILWGHKSEIVDVWYNKCFLYSLDRSDTLKIWQWRENRSLFDNVGVIEDVDRYVVDKESETIEIEHTNKESYVYKFKSGAVIKITPDVWRPENHHLFPKGIQESINVFWDVWSSNETGLSELPPELMVSICSILCAGQSGF